MQLVVLSVRADELAELPVFVSDADRPVVVRVRDGDAATLLAAHGPDWEGSWGVWLEASEAYPAQLIARDVKTLSHLMELDHVVISARADAAAHAEVVWALLTADEVNFLNEVATLVQAYNRPAPASPLTVWYADGEALRSGQVVLEGDVASEDVTVYRD